jgi:hypothetical protein
MSKRLAQIHDALGRFCSSPHVHDVIELVLAVTVSQRFYVGDHPCPLWLMIVGNPSSGKTDSVLGLKGSPYTYFLDSITANSFLSGYMDVQGRGKDPKDQLLNQMNGKTVVFKDLTTLMSGRDEQVKAVLGSLQSIYDGEYAKAIGTLGVLQSKSTFSIVACVTPEFIHRHHQYMAQLGSRFLLIRIPPLTEVEQNKGFECQWDQSVRRTHVLKYAELIAEHIAQGMTAPIELEHEDEESRARLQNMARLVAHGRGQLIRSKVASLDGGTGRERFFYEMTESQREEPFRVHDQLRTLGRALVLIHGRTHLTSHELELLRRAAISSLAPERAAALACIAERAAGVDRATLMSRLGRSSAGTAQLLEELRFLGLVQETKGNDGMCQVSHGLATDLAKSREPLDHIADLTR